MAERIRDETAVRRVILLTREMGTADALRAVAADTGTTIYRLRSIYYSDFGRKIRKDQTTETDDRT